MELSRYKYVRELVTRKIYQKDTLTKQLSIYRIRKLITEDEYTELIALI